MPSHLIHSAVLCCHKCGILLCSQDILAMSLDLCSNTFGFQDKTLPGSNLACGGSCRSPEHRKGNASSKGPQKRLIPEEQAGEVS